MGEVWVAGAAAMLTAATVPSREFRNSNARRICDAQPVMATSMMAALAVEMQLTMGGGEGERMGVVQALR